MAMGTVSFFNPSKGFGFIASDHGGSVYVEFAALERAGIAALRDGERVTFDIERSEFGPDMAINLAVKPQNAED